MGLISIDWKAAAVLALFSAAVVYVAKTGLSAAAETLAEELTDEDGKLNPTNDGNLANTAAVGIWQKVTGSDETPGEDFYDLVHDGSIY